MKRVNLCKVLTVFFVTALLLNLNPAETHAAFPTADPGTYAEQAMSVQFSLNASSSSCGGGCASYSWCLINQPDGSTSTLADPETSTPDLTIDVFGDYEVALVVNDGTYDSIPATVTISTDPWSGGWTQTWSSYGSYTYSVPAGITEIQAEVYGAEAGRIYGGTGGRGGVPTER